MACSSCSLTRVNVDIAILLGGGHGEGNLSAVPPDVYMLNMDILNMDNWVSPASDLNGIYVIGGPCLRGLYSALGLIQILPRIHVFGIKTVVGMV